MVPAMNFGPGDWNSVGGARSVCRRASSVILAMLHTLFDHGLPEKSSLLSSGVSGGQASLDNIVDRRARSALLCRQVKIKELELEALRLSAVRKEAEMVEARKLHEESVRESNEFLVSSSIHLPVLPSEVIKLILDLLCQLEAVPCLSKMWIAETRRSSCAMRLLADPAINAEWKSVISRHFPLRVQSYSTGPPYPVNYTSSKYFWKMIYMREAYGLPHSQAIDIITSYTKLTVDADIPPEPSGDFLDHFKSIERLEWHELAITRNCRNLLRSLVTHFHPSLQAVRSLTAVSGDRPGEDDKDYGVDGIDSPFTALEVAKVPCHTFHYIRSLFPQHLQRLELTVNKKQPKHLWLALRNLPTSVSDLTLTASINSSNGSLLHQALVGAIVIKTQRVRRLRLAGFNLRDMQLLLRIFQSSELVSLDLLAVFYSDSNAQDLDFNTVSFMSLINHSFPLLKSFVYHKQLGPTSNTNDITQILLLSERPTAVVQYHPKTILECLSPIQNLRRGFLQWPLPNLESLEIYYQENVSSEVLELILRIVLGRLDSKKAVSLTSFVMHVNPSQTNISNAKALRPLLNSLKLAVNYFAIRFDGQNIDVFGSG